MSPHFLCFLIVSLCPSQSRFSRKRAFLPRSFETVLPGALNFIASLLIDGAIVGSKASRFPFDCVFFLFLRIHPAERIPEKFRMSLALSRSICCLHAEDTFRSARQRPVRWRLKKPVQIPRTLVFAGDDRLFPHRWRGFGCEGVPPQARLPFLSIF